MNDLKIPHCPFCAGDAAIQVDGATYQIKRVYCECKLCGSRGKAVAFGFVWKNFEMAKKEAIEHWSMRKPMQNISEQLKVLFMINHEAWKNTDFVPDMTVYGNRANAYKEAIEIVKKEGQIIE